VIEDAGMPEAPSAATAHRMLLRLAERVVDRTAWPEWHVEEAPASHVHGVVVILVFTAPADLTVEEVAVTVEQAKDSGGWVVDAIDREGVPLDETAPWNSSATDVALSEDALDEQIASLETRIITVLTDLRRG
jgi:hypothetical protein